MLCESFSRLGSFMPVDEYQYVGFGSPFFRDFILFHRELNITNMVNIEKNRQRQKRFEANKPFSCVSLKYGTATRQLPLLDWEKRKILWLDYDQRLDASMLDDISYFFENAVSGSVIVVTINVKTEGRLTLQLLKDRVGEQLIPDNIDEDRVEGWGLAAVCKEICENQINQRMLARNDVLEEDEEFVYEQLYYFHYNDGTPMLSFGGILYTHNEESNFRGCSFSKLPYIRRNGRAAFEIIVPVLTSGDLSYLNKQLPLTGRTRLKGNDRSIPGEDLVSFRSIYRYFPSFAEIESS